mgnify:FL=1
MDKCFSEWVFASLAYTWPDCAYNIADIIEQMNKRMDEPLIIYYTLEMLKIIEILHGAGIIHGDIKPDNFLIKNNPGAELDDWGSGSAGT